MGAVEEAEAEGYQEAGGEKVIPEAESGVRERGGMGGKEVREGGEVVRSEERKGKYGARESESVPLHVLVWVFLVTWLWFGVELDVDVFKGEGQHGRSIGPLQVHSEPPLWCPCVFGVNHHMTLLRVAKGHPSVVMGWLPADKREREESVPWLMKSASHVFYGQQHKANKVFAIVWANFVPPPLRPIYGSIPSESECELWVSRDISRLGFVGTKGESVQGV